MSSADPETETDRFTGTLPPDPLLQSGCFIDPAASTEETLIKGSEQISSNGEKFQASGQSAVASPSASAQKRSSNGEKTATFAPESAETKRRRRLSTGERRVASGETPDWLPSGWIVEDRVRASGATAGSIDKYYCDPVSGHVFRSKKEVLYYLENGTKRKKSSDNPEAEGSGTPAEVSHKKKSVSAPAAPLNFDFMNPPEKVTWTLLDSTEGLWTPYMDDKKVAESSSREWASAFKFFSVRKR